jgi:5-methylcytosine-specific restriction endonuclease McrA
MMNLQTLSKSRLLSEIARIARSEQQYTVKLLFHLNEIQRRKLHLDLGYSSLWDYCTKELGYSPSGAGRRIAAARCIRRFPLALAMLHSREITLCTLAMIEPILNEENAPTILERVRGASHRAVQKLICEYRPPVALRDQIRPVRVAMAARDVDRLMFERECAQSVPEEWRQPMRIEEKLYVQFVADEALVAKFEQAKALLCGRCSGMSFADVLDVLVTEFLDRRSPTARHERREAKKEKEVSTSNVGSKDKKVCTPNVGSKKRNIPAAVKDEVYVRDGGQCTFTGPDETRCESRKGLEIDHIVPVAAGGTNDIDNLRLLCPAHNLRAAEQALGERVMAPFWQRE